MELFGPFETTRIVESGQRTTIHLARRRGQPDSEGDQFVVKVFHSPAHTRSIDSLDLRASSPGAATIAAGSREEFLQRVTRMQEAGAARAQYVAPIVERGQDERGAWYVTRHYPRSLKRILDGRVNLGGQGIHALLTGVVRGTLELKRTTGCAHGNLKPEVVWIAGQGNVRIEDVALTDVAPGGRESAAGCETGDVRAIGEFIYQLVRRREVSAVESWPVPEGEEWVQAFGPRAKGWIKLCNQLVDPNLPAGSLPLEEVERRLGELRPKVRVPLAMVGAAAAFIIIAVAVFWIIPRRPAMEGRIRIFSNPSRAAAWALDQQVLDEEGKPAYTPFWFRREVPLTNFQINLRQDSDYDEYSLTITNLELGLNKPIEVWLKHHQGTVLISSDPLGADLYTNGRPVGRTPTNLVFDTGRRDVEARFGGLTPLTNRLFVTKGNNSPTNFQFVYGGIVVTNNTTKIPVKVWLHGTNAQDIPYTNPFLNPSKLELVFRANGFNERAIPVIITQGATLTLKAPELTLGRGKIALHTVPPGAEVFSTATGKLLGTTAVGAPLVFDLPVGPDELRIKHPKLKEVRRSVVVEKDARLERSVELPRGAVELYSQFGGRPIAARVYFGTNWLGTTPYTNPFVDPGPISYEIRHGEMSEVVPFIVTNSVLSRATGMLTLATGILQLATIPLDAEVWWETNLLKSAAMTNLEVPLPKGPKQLVAKYGGLDDYLINAIVFREPTNWGVARMSYGGYRLDSRPQNASVKLRDGPEIGRTPFTNNYLRPGKLIELDIDLANYRGESVKFRVPSNALLYTHPLLELHPLTGELILLSTAEDAKATIHSSNTALFVDVPLPWTNSAMLPGEYAVLASDLFSNANWILKIEPNRTERRTFISTAPKTTNTSFGMKLVEVPGVPGTPGTCYVGMFEVTEGEYRAVMTDTTNNLAMRLPEVRVYWTNALNFCEKATARENGAASGWKFTLPTTNQWAHLAGKLVASNAVVATGGRANVGSKLRNEFGLFDTWGNVREWCYGSNGDPVLYGGSFESISFTLARPISDAKNRAFPDSGFRVLMVRTPPAPSATTARQP